MKHLTDEELEDIMQSKSTLPPHLAACEYCETRLAQKRALAERLRSAFAAVEPQSDLDRRIKLTIAALPQGPKRVRLRPLLEAHRHWRGLAAAVSAAVVLIVAVPLIVLLKPPSAARASQAEFVRIHRNNLSALSEFHSEADPEKLAEYFKSKLGFNPALPRPGRGMALRGCCVRHFRGEIAGSYVVDTPAGTITVVVVKDKPESFGMKGKIKRSGYVFWTSSFEKNEMVTVRLGAYSYCAVGETSSDYLVELLSRLLPENHENIDQPPPAAF